MLTVTTDLDVYEVEEYSVCPACYGFAYELGQLGQTTHYRCRDCGHTFEDATQEAETC